MFEFIFTVFGIIGGFAMYLLAAKLVLWMFGFDCHMAIKF